jgi:HD-like signal output (HDOD) protein
MNTAENEIIRKISSGYSLPPLSSIALKFIDIASDEKASLYDMSMLIKEDPALTVRLLKLANSPFYRIPTPVSTIEAAVMRIGCNHIRLMALSISIRDTFPFGRHEQMDFEQYWKASLYQALLARVIAQSLHNCNPDEAFVAGLLSEIGILILFDIFIKDKDKDFRVKLYPLEELLAHEEQRYAINHRKAGEAALRFWKLPEPIVECQRFYPNSPHSSLTPLGSVCEIARQCSNFIIYGDTDWSSFYHRAKKEYNLGQEILTEIMVESFNTVESIAESMKINIDRQRDIEFLVGKAHDSLRKLSCQIESINHKTLPAFSTIKTAAKEPIVSETLQAVAHEIRNPVTILGGFARRLEKILAPTSKEWSYVQQIIEESKRLEMVLSSMTTGRL